MNDAIHDAAARLLAVASTTGLMFALFACSQPMWIFAIAPGVTLLVLGWLEREGDL